MEHSQEHGRKKAVARTFSMRTTADRPSLLARAKRVAKENGATLVGDERSGRFSHGMFRGEYSMAGRKVVVTVTNKHWLLSWSVVESRLRELFRSSPFAARPARWRKRRRKARRGDGQ